MYLHILYGREIICCLHVAECHCFLNQVQLKLFCASSLCVTIHAYANNDVRQSNSRLFQIKKQIDLVNGVYKLHNLPEFYQVGLTSSCNFFV